MLGRISKTASRIDLDAAGGDFLITGDAIERCTFATAVGA
jgi:hypothetical protein